jgi:hypothetical protein
VIHHMVCLPKYLLSVSVCASADEAGGQGLNSNRKFRR